MKDMLNSNILLILVYLINNSWIKSYYWKIFFDISANILINYLRDNGIVADKCDLNPIVFLMAPAETMTKMPDVVNKIIKFEKLVMIIGLWR